MSFCASIQAQVSSIMDVLAKTAVAEIAKLVDDGSAALRLEMCRSQMENEALKTKLLLMEGELRAVRGYGEETPGNSLNLSFEVQVCDQFREAQIRELHTGFAKYERCIFMKNYNFDQSEMFIYKSGSYSCRTAQYFRCSSAPRRRAIPCRLQEVA